MAWGLISASVLATSALAAPPGEEGSAAEQLEDAGFRRERSESREGPTVVTDDGWKTGESTEPGPAPSAKPKSVTAPIPGVFGSVRLGPVIGLAFPQPLNIGAEGRYGREWGFGLNYGFLPEITLWSVSARYSALDLAGRWFPGGGAFFVGGSLGRQSFEGSVPTTINGAAVTVRGEVSGLYLTPQAGFRWAMPSGFLLGIEAGVQIPFFGDTDFGVEGIGPGGITGDAVVNSMIDKIDTVGNVLGFIVLPRVALRVGWMF